MHIRKVTQGKPAAATVDGSFLDKIQQVANTIVAVGDAVAVFQKPAA